jgi:hypothetical protein
MEWVRIAPQRCNRFDAIHFLHLESKNKKLACLMLKFLYPNSTHTDYVFKQT